MPVKLTAAQSTKITSDCVRQVSGSTRPFNPAETLQIFGINATQQLAAVRTNVVSNRNIGVPAFNFSLNAGFLATLSTQTLMGQLASIILNNSVPAPVFLGIADENVANVAMAGARKGGAKKASAKKASAKKASAKKAGAKKSSSAKKASKKSTPARSGVKRSTAKSTKKTSAKKSAKKGRNK